MTQSVDPMAKARTRLLLKFPWYGQLVLRLKTKALDNDAQCPTAATDGVYLYYNPKWFEKLSETERLFTLAHEVRHCALLHMTRRGHRDAQLWNIAADLRINLDLQKEGIGQMPKGGLLDASVGDNSTERIYHDLQKNMKKVKQLTSGGNGWNFGGVMDAPQQGQGKSKQGQGQQANQGQGQEQASSSSTGDLENDWKVAVEQASFAAKKAGRDPLGVDVVLKVTRESKTDWRDVLRKYVTTMGDFSWMRANRRFVGQGIYLPGQTKTRLKRVVFALDTSGSIACSPELMGKLASEASAIMTQAEAWPEVVTIIYCDAAVQGCHDCQGEELSFAPKGGGGTAFQPVFDFIQQQEWRDEVQVLFYLTDLECFDKPQKPSYDVVWIAPQCYVEHGRNNVSFGEVVGIEE